MSKKKKVGPKGRRESFDEFDDDEVVRRYEQLDDDDDDEDEEDPDNDYDEFEYDDDELDDDDDDEFER